MPYSVQSNGGPTSYYVRYNTLTYADAAASNSDGTFAALSDTLTLTFQWQGSEGQAVTPLYVKLTGEADGGDSSVSDGLGDNAVQLSQTDSSSYGSHLRQVAAPAGAGPGTTVTMSVTLSTPASATVEGFIRLQATVDNRAVSISSGIEASYRKGADDITGAGYQIPDLRNSDGSINVDSVVSFDPESGEWVASQTFAANATNFTSPTYAWSLSGGSPNAQTQANLGNLGPENLPATIYFTGTSFPQNGTLIVNVTDSDGTVGTNTYDVTWHLPAEDWVATTPGTSYVTLVASQTDSGTAVVNTSASGQWSYTEDINGSSVSLADMFTVGAGLVDPPYAAFLAAAGVIFSKTQPENAAFTSVNFNQAWTSQYSTFDIPPADDSQATMSQYQMTPFLAVVYQPQHYIGDQYGVHGYIGPTSESFDKEVSIQGCGHFTHL